MSGARGPAAVESCPVCGSPMARGERLRVQVLRETPVTYRSRTSWTWQMVGSTLACPGCAGAVGELLRRLGER